ncbi:MAG: DUF6263 family protein [Phycisphaerae bacterium]
MRTRQFIADICLISLILSFVCGCTPEPELFVRPELGQTVTYKTSMQMQKSVKFDRPSASMQKQDTTMSRYEMIYEQTPKDTDEKGNIVADIKIKSLKYISKANDEINIDFDSQRQQDADRPLAALIGKSYTITMSSEGQVLEIANAEDIRQAVTESSDKKLADNLLVDESIMKRHSVKAFPEAKNRKIAVGDTWSRKETPQVGLMIPKTFEKIYTVKNIASNIATIQMNAVPAAQTQASPLGELFDSQDDFSGELIVNISSGKVIKYRESLTSISLTAQKPGGGTSSTPLDVLEISLSWMHSIQALD